MKLDPPSLSFVELGQGIAFFGPTSTGFGHSNVGVVIDPDGITTIDCGATPAHGQSVIDALATLVPDFAVKRAVVSSPRVAFSGGSAAMWRSAFYSTEHISNQLDGPVNPLALRRLLPDFADHYDDEFRTRPITHEVADGAWLTASSRCSVVAGETAANVALHVVEGGVAFLGAVASFGVCPLVIDANPLVWASTCDDLAARFEGVTLVPGHGPVGTSDDLRSQAAYLRACAHADGQIADLAPGPWDSWANREFSTIAVERAYRVARGDYGLPNSFLQLLGF